MKVIDHPKPIAGTEPARRDYKPKTIPAPFSELPFVYRPKRGFKGASNWHVPPTNDYGQACKIGMEYAAHFAQYIKDNPCLAGSNMLGCIISDIDFKDETAAKGYWVGFFSHLEGLIEFAAQRTNVFADVDRINAYYAEIADRRAIEANPKGNAA